MARRVTTMSLLATLAGCGMPAVAPPAIEDPTVLAKCGVRKSAASPLVTEWPATEKAHLESLIERQAVVVAYRDCNLEILEGCRPQGEYQFSRTTLASDTIEITDVSDLYAKLPLGAAGLEAELTRSGRLAIHTTAVGQVRLTGEVTVPKTQSCAGATHVIRAISVGAFDMVAGGEVAGGAGFSAGPVGGGARQRMARRQLRSGGVTESCQQTQDEPHRDCRSPLQLFLTPVTWAPASQAEPAAPVARPEESPAERAVEPATASPASPASPASLGVPSPSSSARLDRFLGRGTAAGGLDPRRSSSAVCDDMRIEVLRITPERPRRLHLPRGGSRVVLKVVNRSTDPVELPTADALQLIDRDGQAFTERHLPDASLWTMPVTVPAEASLGLQVVVDAGLTKAALASLKIGRIRAPDDPFDRCELTVSLPPAEAPPDGPPTDEARPGRSATGW